MKKLKKLSVCILALLFALFAFTACAGQDKAAAAPADPVISQSEMTDTLKEFLGISDASTGGTMGNRTAFSASEKAAAEWLKEYCEGFTDGGGARIFDVKLESFSFNNGKSSQNVTARLKGSGAAPRRQVVIGTQADNSFGEYTKDGTDVNDPGKPSTGAMDNATGVAVVMNLMRYYAANPAQFDIVFAFFGAGAVNSLGANYYVENQMSEDERANTLLMFNVKRLGGDKMYLYSEEVKTEHFDFIMKKSGEEGLGINSVPKNIPTLEAQYIARLPYTHWAMASEHAPFMNRYINVASVSSGNYSTLYLGDAESSGFDKNIGGTKNDTFDNLVSRYPDYARQMSVSAQLIVKTLADEGFVAAMESSAKNYNSYSWAVNTLVARFIVMGVIVLLVVLLILLVKYFEKKYPYVPKVKRLKVAVFGMDYEQKNDEDIFVELNRQNNPFGKTFDPYSSDPFHRAGEDKKDDDDKNNPFS